MKRRLIIAAFVAVLSTAILAASASAVVKRYGNDGTKVSYQVPTAVGGTAEVVEVAASNNDNCMRTADGRVFTQGSNDEGALGDNNAVPQSESAIEVKLPAGAIAVSVGEAKDACIVVTSTGHMFVWGQNASGEICLPTTQPNYPVPTEVPGVTEAVQATGAASHIEILLASGRLESCGKSGIGLGKKVKQVDTPTLIPGLENVVQISAGANDSGAVTASGEVCMWGDNKKGEIGNGTKKTAYSPVCKSLPKPVLFLSVGGNANNGHVEALLTENVVMGWGEDEAGEIGDGSERVKLSPVVATEFASAAGITVVIASGYTTMVLTESGEVFSLGFGKYQGTTESKSSFTPILIASGGVEIGGTARNQDIRTEEA
jgi:alpha-tubulin suppressor-like RCC1 family protein